MEDAEPTNISDNQTDVPTSPRLAAETPSNTRTANDSSANKFNQPPMQDLEDSSKLHLRPTRPKRNSGRPR